jgi:hypothetical protein
MFFNGIHINISMPKQSKKYLYDLVEKLNYYAPYIIPYAFSSPFYNNTIFKGLSSRNYFLYGEGWEIAKLTSRNNIDVIEFRGFDVCGDIKLLKALLLLIKGVILDQTLKGRTPVQNGELLQRSAMKGFDDTYIREKAKQVLLAVKETVVSEGEDIYLLLWHILEQNDSYALRMKKMYSKNQNIIETISGQYAY